MEQTKYDVFISYSRKDYVVNDEIIPGNPITAIQELFDKNGVKYWFDKEGIYSGEEFVEVIADAIANSKMLVFVSSMNSNESEYTCGEILKAKKAKKLIIPFLIDECDYNKKFEILLLPLNHIDYVNQPNTSLPELLRAVNKEKERIRLIEQERERALQLEQIKKEISIDVEKFQSLMGQQDFLLRSLYAKSRDLGVKSKTCPVCGTNQPVDILFCDSCGWQFSSLYGVYGVDSHSIHDEKHLRIARRIWKDVSEAKDNKDRIEELQRFLVGERQKNEVYAEEVTRLKATAQLLEQKNQDQKKQLQTKESELAKTQSCLENAHNEIQNWKSEFKNINREYNELRVRVNDSEKKFREEKSVAEMVRVFTVGGVSFKMIKVVGGSFMMGSHESDSHASDKEKPQHSVTLSEYYIGETQVTQALWKAVMGNNPSHWKGDDLPVECVSWEDCQEFIKRINIKTGAAFRLPTEAQWEYAARGGNKSLAYYYAGNGDSDAVAWFKDNSGGMTHPVKQKLANELGLYDMSGNVWEWCLDWYGNYSATAQANPTGPSIGYDRVIRGGCWNYNSSYSRIASRFKTNPENCLINIGFRLALVH